MRYRILRLSVALAFACSVLSLAQAPGMEKDEKDDKDNKDVIKQDLQRVIFYVVAILFVLFVLSS